MVKKINLMKIKPIKIKPINFRFNLDTDRDRVKDYNDCKPFDPFKQHKDPGDWMDTEKRRPRKEKKLFEDVPFEEYEEMSFKGKMKYMESLSKTEIGEKEYKNYHIEFRRYPKGHKVDPYEGKPGTDIYLPGIVYATGFEYDTTSPYGVKQGKTISVGKTVAEAFSKAKQYIDRQDWSGGDKKTIDRLRKRQKEFDKIHSRLNKLTSIGAKRKYTEKEKEELIELSDRLHDLIGSNY